MTGRRGSNARMVVIAVSAVAVVAAAAGGAFAALGGGGTARQSGQPTHSRASATVVATVPAGARPFTDAPLADYRTAVAVAVRDHLRVWIEADMVKRWQDGPASFSDAVARVAKLANRPGVVGIKIADELGYHDGLTSSAEIQQFLVTTTNALRKAAPGKRILVDMVVPQLGCLPGRGGRGPESCAAAAQAKYPQLALSAIDGYLELHAIDVLDLSVGILSASTYATWGATPDLAEQLAWQEAGNLGWANLVRLQARKALAHPGRYPGTAAKAASDLHTFVDIPLASGASAVDVWTWHQEYKGTIYRLMNPGSQPNTLWSQLRLRRAHDELFTHMSPHSVDSGVRADLATIATVFTDIFLPAGTG